MENKKGLIIKSPWIELILQGIKIWEIRSKNTKIRGKIYLIKSGTGKIYGEIDLIDCISIKKENFYKYKNKHCVTKEDNFKVDDYKNIYAWIFNNPIIYDNPIPYVHKQGAIIWVNL